MVFFELDYDKRYELEVYDIKSLAFISRRIFECYISNFCANQTEIVSWSSEREPYVCFFDYYLNKCSTQIHFDERIFEKYYALTDYTDNQLVFHNQNYIGIVARDTGKILNEINMLEESDKEEDNLSEQEMEHLNRNRAYLSHAKFEYINVKFCFSTNLLILTTWSKIFLFELKNDAKNKEKFDLLVKNDLRLIVNNNWNLPNGLFVNNDGHISFFDSLNKCLTFL